MKRICLVDPFPVVRRGLRATMECVSGYEMSGEFSNARDAISSVPALVPDLVICEVTLPDVSGLELIKELQALCPKVHVLTFSAHDEMLYAERVLRAGGRGFLMKESPPELVLQAIQTVLEGNIYLSQKVSNRLLGIKTVNGHRPGRPDMSSLSDRELEVFGLIGWGKSSHEISDQLCVCLRTVEAHRTHIREKLSLASAADVIRHAVLWVESERC